MPKVQHKSFLTAASVGLVRLFFHCYQRVLDHRGSDHDDSNSRRYHALGCQAACLLQTFLNRAGSVGPTIQAGNLRPSPSPPKNSTTAVLVWCNRVSPSSRILTRTSDPRRVCHEDEESLCWMWLWVMWKQEVADHSLYCMY